MKRKKSTPLDAQGMFFGMVVFLIESGVQSRRLQIWKQKLTQMGAKIEDSFSKNVTHVFSSDFDFVLQKIDRQRLTRSKAKVVLFQWIEDSLREGIKVSEDEYILPPVSRDGEIPVKSSEGTLNKPGSEGYLITTGSSLTSKKSKVSQENSRDSGTANTVVDDAGYHSSRNSNVSEHAADSLSSEVTSHIAQKAENDSVVTSTGSVSLYLPPNLNSNITEIFGKLVEIYRALGDDRRSFSYHKAIPVIEKLAFKIESVDQVKNLPGIGKSLQDHIQEIVTTGKLSKLDHFEQDEKVKTISLFGEVWGVGPATALKLYEKGHRTLDDLQDDESLTHAQRVGLKYFNDIKTRIPRAEVEEMECLLQRAGEDILPGVVILCGGSYRRGKASCGDMDVVITHPDRKSHRGFLSKYVKHLKDMNFLREELIFSVHSEEDAESGVDTYFGLCTCPSQELRRRIDLKVYPRDIYAFGLIAWTGNDVLNRRLRLLAETKGLRLDDTGLFPATQSSGKRGGWKGGASLKFDTEKEVFDFLGFPWLQPHERNL